MERTPTPLFKDDADAFSSLEICGDVSLHIKSDTQNTSEQIVDSSSRNCVITKNGDVAHNMSQETFGNSSLYFDGTYTGLTAKSDNALLDLTILQLSLDEGTNFK